MRKLQSQGVHHITIVGADRQTSIDFWEGVLGMPFVFEQPNLDNESESHLYFDPGDGRLITIFTNEERQADSERTPTDPGCVHHLAFALSQATFHQAVERGDYNIDRVHLADAIETLVTRSRASLSDDRSPKDPYG
jgi:glyoxalase family protein